MHKSYCQIFSFCNNTGDKALCNYSFEKVWETLKFKVFINKTYYDHDATGAVDICKLQFVLKSKPAQSDFLARLSERYEFQVLQDGIVKVHGIPVEEDKLKGFWQKLEQSINHVLRQKIAQSLPFHSTPELKGALEKLNDDAKRLITNEIVGIFVSYKDNKCTAKLVGTQQDVDMITEELHAVLAARGKRGIADSPHHQHGVDPKSFRREEFECSVTITEDEDFYFHAIKITGNLKKKFPDVRVIREGNEGRTFKFISTDQNELEKAVSWFDSQKDEMCKKELELLESEHKFIGGSENVHAYLQVKLQKMHAVLRIPSNRIYILCHKSQLETSQRIVWDYIKSVEVKSKWSSYEAAKILKESRQKIQYFEGNEADRHFVLYTLDMTASAQEIVKMLQKYKYVQERQYSQQQIGWMNKLGVLEDLQEKFKDILVEESEAVYILRALGEDRLAACSEELDTKVRNLLSVQLNYLPKLAQRLLKNDKVQSYVKNKLKVKVAFLELGTSLVFIKENENDKSELRICRDIQDCFYEMEIDTDYLNNKKGEEFLSQHLEEVAKAEDSGKKGHVNICFTANLCEEVTSLLYSYSEDCSYIIRDYLQKFGKKCRSEIGEKQEFKISLDLDNDRICGKGPYQRAKKAVVELESHVDTKVLHFGEVEYQHTILSENDKAEIDSIAKSCQCSWDAVVFPFKPEGTIKGKIFRIINFKIKMLLYISYNLSDIILLFLRFS